MTHLKPYPHSPAGKHTDPHRPLIIVSYRDIFTRREVVAEWDWTTAQWHTEREIDR